MYKLLSSIGPRMLRLIRFTQTSSSRLRRNLVNTEDHIDRELCGLQAVGWRLEIFLTNGMYESASKRISEMIVSTVFLP